MITHCHRFPECKCQRHGMYCYLTDAELILKLADEVSSTPEASGVNSKKENEMETREIKFRGKRIDNGDFVYGTYHYSNDGKYHYILAREKFVVGEECMWLHDKEVWHVDPETVGMWLGIKDINGKDIFQHDIVNFDNTTMTCCWIEEDCQFQFIQIAYREFHNVTNECEVIGNIHEKIISPK